MIRGKHTQARAAVDPKLTDKTEIDSLHIGPSVSTLTVDGKTAEFHDIFIDDEDHLHGVTQYQFPDDFDVKAFIRAIVSRASRGENGKKRDIDLKITPQGVIIIVRDGPIHIATIGPITVGSPPADIQDLPRKSLKELISLAKQIGVKSVIVEYNVDSYDDVDDAINPNEPEAYNIRGVARAHSGDLTGALSDFSDAIHLSPNSPQARYNLGLAQAETRQFPEAIASFREAIKLKPDWAKAHYGLGVTLGKTGKLSEAIAAFRNARKVAPDVNTRREIALLIKEYLKQQKEVEFGKSKAPTYTHDSPPPEPAVIPRPPMGEPSEEIDRLAGNRARLPGMTGHEQEEAHIDEPLQRLVALLQEHPEISDDVFRSANEILARKSRTPWLERSKKPALANLTAPAFLRVVWASAKKADGSFDRSAIKDKELLNAVSAYIGDREARIRSGTAVGFGDAEGLRLNRGKAGRPKLAHPPPSPSDLKN